MTDAFNRRDFDSIMALYSQTSVWDTSAIGLGVHKGPEAVRAFHEDWQRAYEDFEMVMTDFEEIGNGITITVFDQRARPTGGSGFVELRFGLVTTWADGLVQRATAYTDIGEARAAAERLARERSMPTRENAPAPTLVELAQRTLDAANAGDFDALQDLYAPDAVWNAPGADIVEERFEGNAAIRRFLESWYLMLEESEVRAEEICDVGSGVILAQLVQQGRPPGGTGSIEFRHATVSVWVAGLIVENSAYIDVDEARAAAERLAKERADG